MADECFFIAPIGDAGSATRTHSDRVLAELVSPVVKSLIGQDPVRADHIDEAGQISTHIIQRLADAPLAIADVTFPNANVFYELGLRHTIGKAVSLLALAGTVVPFDVRQFRVTFFDLDNQESVVEARRRLLAELKAATLGRYAPPLQGFVNLPLDDEQSVNLIALHQASASYRIYKVLEDMIAREEARRGSVDEITSYRQIFVALAASRHLCAPFASLKLGNIERFLEEQFPESELAVHVNQGVAIVRSATPAADKRLGVLALLESVQERLHVKLRRILGDRGVVTNDSGPNT